MAEIYINIRPTPAPRPRVTKNGTYNPANYTKYKRDIAEASKGIFEHSQKPMHLHCYFYFKIPKSWNKQQKQDPPHHTSKPDVDNLLKGIKDALNGIAYKDDSQIVSVFALKKYEENDGVFIQLKEVENG